MFFIQLLFFVKLTTYGFLSAEHSICRRKGTATDQKDGSETHSDFENVSTAIPEPLTLRFDPTAVNMVGNLLDKFVREMYHLYFEDSIQKGFENLNKLTEMQSSNQVCLSFKTLFWFPTPLGTPLMSLFHHFLNGIRIEYIF